MAARKERNTDRAELLKRITVNAEILVAKPTIRGMHMSVEQILDTSAARVAKQELLEEHPVLEPDDIGAVLLCTCNVDAGETRV